MGPKVIGINLNQGRPLKSFLAHLRSVAKNNQGWSLVKFEDDSVVVTNFYRAMRSRNVYDTLIWWVVVPVAPISWIKPRPRIEYEWNDSTAAKTTRKRDDSFIVCMPNTSRIVEQRRKWAKAHRVNGSAVLFICRLSFLHIHEMAPRLSLFQIQWLDDIIRAPMSICKKGTLLDLS